MKYSVIVPCYNEELNIHGLVDRLEAVRENRNVEYIMVENGSADGTRAALEKECEARENFKIAYVDKNVGYGFGIISGMKKAEGDYIGWLHADLQVNPSEMMKFVDYIEKNQEKAKYFLKGIRKNRKFMDHFFTAGMTVYASMMLGTYVYDIGAIPVIFHRSLLDYMDETIPYDFSIETYVYYKAKHSELRIERFPIYMDVRKKGESSWNKGFSSKIRQSKVIMKDIGRIRKGEAVR